MNPNEPAYVPEARVLDQISQKHVRPDLDLLPGILATIQQGKRGMRSSRGLESSRGIKSSRGMESSMKVRFARVGAAALLLAVVVIILLFTVPGVARAVRSLFGYIPGVGRVEQGGPLRVLVAPVSDSRDGYTISVESAVLDATRSVITYRTVGPFPNWDDPALRPPMCPGQPVLRLPNGVTLANPSGEGGSNGKSGSNGVEWTWKLVFGPLPADVNRAALVLPCLPGLPAGEGPRDWAFELAFAPAPAALTVYPVVDLPTPTPPATSAPVAPLAASATPSLSAPTISTAPAVATAPAPSGVTWRLDRMAVLADGYYLETTLTWPVDMDAYDVQLYPDALHLADAAGQAAAVWQTGDVAPFTLAKNGAMPLNLQTSALNHPGPARLTLDYLAFSQSANATFTIDVGSDPQPGQIWPVNQDLDLGGQHLRVLSAKYFETRPGWPVMLMLDLESDSGIIAVIASDLEHETLDSGGRPASSQGPMQAGWHYRGAFPQGTITVTVSMITKRVDGPWTVEWTPPADAITPAPEEPTAMPTLHPELALCQAGPLLETAADGLAASGPVTNVLPDGLGGRVAYTKFIGERGELFVSNLDGSGVIALGPGAFPDLSADGQQVVYRGVGERTYVRDLTSGVERMLPGSLHPGAYDNWPKWSPDGRQIAFYRVTGNVASGSHTMDLYVMDADGSNLRAVTSGPEDEILIGWNANGTGLYYKSIGAAGQSVQLLDLATGQPREIARLPDRTISASLSPDGSRLLYLTEQALWLDRLDGSPAQALLATNGHFANQIHPLWSPDGRWVTVNYWETPDGQPKLALLSVDECRLVHLTTHPGDWLSAWVVSNR